MVLVVLVVVPMWRQVLVVMARLLSRTSGNMVNCFMRIVNCRVILCCHLLLGDHVLVVVDPGEGDLGLIGGEGGHREQPHLVVVDMVMGMVVG